MRGVNAWRWCSILLLECYCKLNWWMFTETDLQWWLLLWLFGCWCDALNYFVQLLVVDLEHAFMVKVLPIVYLWNFLSPLWVSLKCLLRIWVTRLYSCIMINLNDIKYWVIKCFGNHPKCLFQSKLLINI